MKKIQILVIVLFLIQIAFFASLFTFVANYQITKTVPDDCIGVVTDSRDGNKVFSIQKRDKEYKNKYEVIKEYDISGINNFQINDRTFVLPISKVFSFYYPIVALLIVVFLLYDQYVLISIDCFEKSEFNAPCSGLCTLRCHFYKKIYDYDTRPTMLKWKWFWH